MLGLTQQQMAELIGVTYQQAHKYETGINRISAGRLYQIAQALGVEISYFFEDVEPERRGKPKAAELMPQQRMLLELARNFASIGSRKHQDALCNLARVLANGERRPADAKRSTTGRLAARPRRRRGLADDPQGLRPEAERGQLVEREPGDRRGVVARERLARGASAVKSTSV